MPQHRHACGKARAKGVKRRVRSDDIGDFSAEDEAFRVALRKRLLSSMHALDDDALELVSAAGDPSAAGAMKSADKPEGDQSRT